MSDMYTNNSGDDKRTLIAVVLSVVIITAGFMIQGALFPATSASPQNTQTTAQQGSVTTSVELPSPGSTGISVTAAVVNPTAVTPPLTEQRYRIETDIVEAEFTNKGGDLVALRLKKHKDQEGEVNLILAGAQRSEGFALAFGGPNAAPVDELMEARMLDDKTIEFSRTFLAPVVGKDEPVAFTYRKAFTFRDGEYLFGLAVTLENSRNEYLPLDEGGYAYTLRFGPQVGPRYNYKSKNSDYRQILSYADGKSRLEKPKTGVWSPKTQPVWTAINGKYFSFIAIPELPTYTLTVTGGNDAEIGQTNGLAISRPAIKASRQSDAFYFYFGPRTNAELAKYEYADRNAFGKSGLSLERAVSSSGILAPLEKLLKFLLNVFYKLIPNYGVAIVLVTILVKVLLFPLTKKGSMASARMQEIQPKLTAIQEKYKNNPQKLNAEMAELYKKEGYNPMSGCLPLLIQFPLFIAMYNLFNNHFDLRGALFIPGWIPDLSAPETIWNFAPFKLPLLGWSDIRALPIIYLVSQLFYGKFTQQPSSGPAAGQMKFMMYGMPIIFFFILYDVPSGLLVYWIVSNLLTIAQQVAINDILKKRKAAKA